MRNTASATIIPFRDLEPTWTTKQATEAGFNRWLVTWVGGPEGHVNTNPGVALEAPNFAVGMMVLPHGQRQAGVHTHSVTEIYVILQGVLEGLDASGHSHRAGPLDCTYTPVGCPHGVRNAGMEDVILFWIHDGVERNGTAVYYYDDHAFGDVPPMELVKFADLEASHEAPGAKDAGTRRWMVNWVGGLEGSFNHNPSTAIGNSRVAIGMTVLEPGHAEPGEALGVNRLYLVMAGAAIVSLDGRNAVLTRLDGLHVPAGERVRLRNNGPDTLRLLWVDAPKA